MPSTTVEGRTAFADAMTLLAAVSTGALGLFLLIGSRNPGMAFHGLLFLAAGMLSAIFILHYSFDSGSLLEGSTGGSDGPAYVDGPIKVATIAAVVWGIAGFLVGDVLAWQL